MVASLEVVSFLKSALLSGRRLPILLCVLSVLFALDPTIADRPPPVLTVLIEEVLVDGTAASWQEGPAVPFGADDLQMGLTASTVDRPDRVQYTVLPRWWQAWWSRVGVVLVMAALIVAGFRIRMRTITRRSVELEQEVGRRRAAEASLGVAEALGRSTLDALTSPVVVLDDKGTIIAVNQSWKQFGENNGAAADLVEGIGWNYFDMCRRASAADGGSATQVLEGLQSLLEGRAAVFDLEYECHSPTERRWFLLRAVPVLEGRPGLVVSHIDITRHVLSELELRDSQIEVHRQREEMAHVQRTAALGELTGAFSHEINQPLAAIRTNAQAALRFLRQDKPDLEEIREILTDIAEDDRRASEVIERLRAMLKKQSVVRSQIDINQMVGKAVELIGTEAMLEKVEVHLQLEDGMDPVLGDEIQLQQVMVNLLLNAMEAMAGGKEESRKILLHTRPEPDFEVRVSITDTGPGLVGQSQEEIFAPFHTTKPEGLGIGLSISRTIVESHGGKIWAESSPDRGATFHFTLPADPAQSPEEA